jgi:hypothetical protein
MSGAVSSGDMDRAWFAARRMGALSLLPAVLIAGYALASCHPARAGPTDKMRSERVSACVKMLQRNDKALRSKWRGPCGAIEFLSGSGTQAERLRNMFLDGTSIVVAGDGSCGNDGAPIATTPRCGLGSRGLDPAMTGAAVRVRLPGNRCGEFIPVLLTNKSRFACNAVRSRVACIDASYDAQTDRTRITFSSRRSAGAQTTSIEFGADELAKVDGRIGALITHPQFTIVPEFSGSEPVARTIAEASRVQEQECIRSGRSRAACSRQAMFYTDAKLQEAARRYRNPRRDSSPDALAEDSARIVAFLKANDIDRIEERWLLFLAIAANELGLKLVDGAASTKEPIYGLSDAVDYDSGLTFGAHQIDLGASTDRGLRLFWEVIKAYRTAHPDAALDEAEIKHSCLELPLRLMTVEALALTYRSAPKLTAALRSAEGVEAYNRRLLSYLAAEARLTAAKSGLFRHSMIVRILFSDLKNQLGTGADIEKLAREASRDGIDLSSCASIVAGEDRILERLIWNRPGEPAAGKTQFAYRYENIRRTVRSLAAHGGVSACS